MESYPVTDIGMAARSDETHTFLISTSARVKIFNALNQALATRADTNLFCAHQQPSNAAPQLVKRFCYCFIVLCAVQRLLDWLYWLAFGMEADGLFGSLFCGNIMLMFWAVDLTALSLFVALYCSPFSVSVDGLLGVGKSTLVNRIQEMYPKKSTSRRLKLTPRLDAYEEKVEEHWLRSFYETPKKYAFAFQIERLLHTIYSTTSAQRDMERDRSDISLIDRSTIGNLPFAMLHYASDSFALEDFELYLASLVNKAPYCVDVALLLNAGVDEVYKRVRQRSDSGERDAEKGIPIDYLHRLNEANALICVYAYCKYDYPLIVADWNLLPSVAEVRQAWKKTRLIVYERKARLEGAPLIWKDKGVTQDLLLVACARWIHTFRRAWIELTDMVRKLFNKNSNDDKNKEADEVLPKHGISYACVETEIRYFHSKYNLMRTLDGESIAWKNLERSFTEFLCERCDYESLVEYLESCTQKMF